MKCRAKNRYLSGNRFYTDGRRRQGKEEPEVCVSMEKP